MADVRAAYRRRLAVLGAAHTEDGDRRAIDADEPGHAPGGDTDQLQNTAPYSGAGLQSQNNRAMLVSALITAVVGELGRERTSVRPLQHCTSPVLHLPPVAAARATKARVEIAARRANMMFRWVGEKVNWVLCERDRKEE